MITTPSIVLAGFESARKTALFRRLTEEATGHGANFRRATVSCRSCHSAESQCEIVDTPGMRLKADSVTTRLALEKIPGSDTVLLVVQGTNLQQEMEELLGEINDFTKRLAVAVTFADKDEKKFPPLPPTIEKRSGCQSSRSMLAIYHPATEPPCSRPSKTRVCPSPPHLLLHSPRGNSSPPRRGLSIAASVRCSRCWCLHCCGLSRSSPHFV